LSALGIALILEIATKTTPERALAARLCGGLDMELRHRFGPGRGGAGARLGCAAKPERDAETYGEEADTGKAYTAQA
jgi:hypothetical protein